MKTIDPKESPRPWVHEDYDARRIFDREAGDLIATFETEEDANYAVRAVNYHEEILGVVRVTACVVCKGYYGDRHTDGCADCASVRAMVARAEGRP